MPADHPLQRGQALLVREGALDLKDAADVIEQRLKNAAQEMACADAYRFTVVNDALAVALREIHDILDGEAMK